MRTRPRARVVVGIIATVCWLATASFTVAGQGESPAPKPDVPEPVLSSEGTSASPKQTATLSLEERGDLLMAKKSYADALEFYLRALKAPNNKESRIWNKVGIVRQNLQDMAGARKAYKQAIRYRKDFSEPYNNVGTTYYLSDQPKKSLKWYRQAIQRNPGNPAFHYNLGTALYATKRIKEAIEAYTQTLRLDPEFFASRSNVGTTLQARPTDAKYFFYMAKVFASLGRQEEAVRYLRRALEDGFKDFEMIDQDPDLKTMAQYPPYVDLRANPPKPL